jgi:hypothetical protein
MLHALSRKVKGRCKDFQEYILVITRGNDSNRINAMFFCTSLHRQQLCKVFTITTSTRCLAKYKIMEREGIWGENYKYSPLEEDECE